MGAPAALKEKVPELHCVHGCQRIKIRKHRTINLDEKPDRKHPDASTAQPLKLVAEHREPAL